MKISQILDIRRGITALIGGGGKTTLMYRLAEELSADAAVIVCTSTKILKPDHLPVLTDGDIKSVIAALKREPVVCVGTEAENGKLSAPSIGFCTLAEIADYVLVEADGAHQLPIKAHAGYEPVIPDGTNKTVSVIGADCFSKPISDICHRPELFAVIAGADVRSTVTPEIAARVIGREGLGDCLFVNKAEDEKAQANARETAKLLHIPVIAGSLKKEEYICLH